MSIIVFNFEISMSLQYEKEISHLQIQDMFSTSIEYAVKMCVSIFANILKNQH